MSASSCTTRCQEAEGSNISHALAPVLHSTPSWSHEIGASSSRDSSRAHSLRAGWAMMEMLTCAFVSAPLIPNLPTCLFWRSCSLDKQRLDSQGHDPDDRHSRG